MARLIYSLLFYVFSPFMVLRLFWRSRKAPDYRKRIGERFGFSSITAKPNTVLIHCVSVGETLAAAPLIEALLAHKPDHRLVLTSTTPTGSAQVKRLFGDRVSHCYLPYDLPDAVARFMRRIQPSMAIFIETEVWPNMIHYCQQQNIPTALVNARMSEKSFLGYIKLHWLSLPMFAGLNLITAQHQSDAKFLAALGAKNIVVSGSLKNDFVIRDAMRDQASKLKAQWQQILGDDLVCIIAASTHAGEDQLILDSFAQINTQHPNTLLILVPRHPERFKSVSDLSIKAGFNTQKRTDKTLDANTQVLIGDTMGELQMLFGTADIAIMGGTFIENGGHNFLEPAAWGIPIISGQSVFNFAAISEALKANQGLVTVPSTEALNQEIQRLLDDSALRAHRGQAAQYYVEQNRGAVKRNLEQLNTLFNQST